MNGTVVGGVTISSNGPPSVEWKISHFDLNFAHSLYSYDIRSASFPHNNIEIYIQLTVNELNRVLLQVYQSPGSQIEIDLFHKILIKRENGSVYKSLEIGKNNNAVDLASLAELNQQIPDHSIHGPVSHLIISFEFIPVDGSVQYNSSLLSTALETSKLSSPSATMDCCKSISGLNALSKNFTDSYLEGELCDITIHVGEKQFKAHKFVLSARSPVFAAMMKHDMVEKNSNAVTIKDCEPGIFEKFLLYLYSGKVQTLSNDNVLGLHKVADKYSVDNLKEDCVNYMKNNLSVDVFCDIIELAAHHDESELFKLSKRYFTKNTRKILLSTRWQTFLKENSVLANELFLLMVPDN